MSEANGGGRVVWVDSLPADDDAPWQDVHAEDVLRVVTDASSVLVDEDTVVFEVSSRTTHILDPLAGLIWRCINGRDSLEAILDDVADAINVAPAKLISDVLPVASSWLTDGLVEVVKSE